jgi:hypothetical protein
MQRTEPELELKIVRSKEKALASQHRLKVVDWPVVALAEQWSKRAGPRTPTQRNATNAKATTTPNAMPL